MGHVSLTADTWSDQSYNSYLAVTAHWVAQVDGTLALQLKTVLIAFHCLEQGHTGQTLAITVMHLLDRAGITLKVRQRHSSGDWWTLITQLKVGHITLNNALNNKTMVKALKTILANRDVSFDACDHRIMCFAHIINLCSGRVINATSNMAGDEDSNLSSSDGAVPSNPIDQACMVVWVIWASGQCQLAFNCTIINGNKEGWFTDSTSKIVKVKPLQLLRDVCTRWDSIFYMLTRLLEMRPVSPYPHHPNFC